jgi:hypothetical protein
MIANGQVVSFNAVEQECLTSAGRILQKTALSDTANHVASTPAGTSQTYYSVPIFGLQRDCFGGGNQFPVAALTINVTSTLGQASATYVLAAQLPGVFLPLIEETETETLLKWQELKQSRSVAESSRSCSDYGACAPRIP